VGSQKLFERYLAATDPDDDAESMLESLLVDFAHPIAKRVVRSRLGSLYTPADAAELSSEAMLELLSRLRSFRAGAAGAADFPFDALTAGVAANTVHRFFARRFPERSRLRKRLRYAVETGDRFRLWLTADGATVCGLAAARAGDRLADAADIERCLSRLRTRPLPAHPLSTLVFEILRALARPVDLSRLTGIAADLTGIQEPSFASPSTGGEEDAPEFPADPAPSAAARLELRQQLEGLWSEVLLLSPRHRNALLLSARASSGAALWLLADLGIASFRAIAAALETTVDDLAALWNLLPLADTEIAARLGLARQQVINLRSTARERLERGPKPIRGLNRR
jgi:DNA-directed RNA polymerase specialized sigma24 family protein